MGNFISNLTQKSFTPTATSHAEVLPRIPSAFEPAPRLNVGHTRPAQTPPFPPGTDAHAPFLVEQDIFHVAPTLTEPTASARPHHPRQRPLVLLPESLTEPRSERATTERTGADGPEPSRPQIGDFAQSALPEPDATDHARSRHASPEPAPRTRESSDRPPGQSLAEIDRAANGNTSRRKQRQPRTADEENVGDTTSHVNIEIPSRPEPARGDETGRNPQSFLHLVEQHIQHIVPLPSQPVNANQSMHPDDRDQTGESPPAKIAPRNVDDLSANPQPRQPKEIDLSTASLLPLLKHDWLREQAERRQVSAQATEIAPPPPTIQVTIGRIEVRAAHAQPAPARQAPAQRKTISLDEYLRRRSEGASR